MDFDMQAAWLRRFKADAESNLKAFALRLKATIAMVVRGIVLNTRSVDPAEWFAKLADETRKATAHAQALSRSLASFMVS